MKIQSESYAIVIIRANDPYRVASNLSEARYEFSLLNIGKTRPLPFLKTAQFFRGIRL
jgi:hypothetical protein